MDWDSLGPMAAELIGALPSWDDVSSTAGSVYDTVSGMFDPSMAAELVPMMPMEVLGPGGLPGDFAPPMELIGPGGLFPGGDMPSDFLPPDIVGPGGLIEDGGFGGISGRAGGGLSGGGAFAGAKGGASGSVGGMGGILPSIAEILPSIPSLPWGSLVELMAPLGGGSGYRGGGGQSGGGGASGSW